MPLGIGGSIQPEYRDVVLPIESGDLLVMTSDGVVEATAQSGELYGFHRLEAAVASGPCASAVDMISHLRAHIMHFVGDREPHDDMTLVVVRC
jgi:serine phosphatase RsbU (regulator of sigma subunit)